MGTTAQKLQKLADTKAAIGQVITGAGGTLPQKFADYSTAISGAIEKARQDEILLLTSANSTGSYSITDTRITTLRNYAFRSCDWLTSYSAPNCTTVEQYAFYYATNLASVNLPAVTSVGTGAFRQTALTSLRLPLLPSLAAGFLSQIYQLESCEAGTGGEGLTSISTVFGSGQSVAGTYPAFRTLTVKLGIAANAISTKAFGWSATEPYAPNFSDFYILNKTMAQVKAMTYYSTWNLPTTCTIHCTDGSFTYRS